MPAGLDVLAVAAHPDDAEAACGGLLAKLAQRGYRVAICDLTRGERASNGTPEERAVEARDAGRTLGLTDRIQLGLPDGGLDGGDPEQITVLVRLLRAQPVRLLIGPHEHSRHPDHAETSELVRRAHFYCAVRNFDPETPAVARPLRIRALDYHPIQPSFVVDITGFLETKLKALVSYRSQFERNPGSVPTHINDPVYLERVRTNARTYGQLAGCEAGEPYVLDGSVRVDDPIRLLLDEEPA